MGGKDLVKEEEAVGKHGDKVKTKESQHCWFNISIERWNWCLAATSIPSYSLHHQVDLCNWGNDDNSAVYKINHLLKIETVVIESLHLSILDAERPKSPKEDSSISSTTKSTVLQKGAGKRVVEEDIGGLNSKGGEIVDLNSKGKKIGDLISKCGKKMKGNRGRPWMDETEGRVIHTAGKTQLMGQEEEKIL